eukprot:Rmarinus@m.20680
MRSSGCPYHAASEAWYATSMEGSQPSLCSDDGEDANCSNSLVFPASIEDHVTYFDARVGIMCCPNLFDGVTTFEELPEEHQQDLRRELEVILEAHPFDSKVVA